MSLRSFVNGATRAVRPNTAAKYRASTGYETDPAGRRAPSYAADIDVFINKQALTGKDLQQIAGLNLQGELRAIYVEGDWRAVSRPDFKGGDLVVTARGTWLVAQVLENWDTWTKVAAVRQKG